MENRLTKVLQKISQAIVMVSCAILGYGASWCYERLSERLNVESQVLPPSCGIEQVSVAMNERGELLLIDRSTGTYQVYTDGVTRNIFDLYATRMYANANAK
jgi:hypothetical protein